jgi:glycosyltransferase involved in cell wall biosynthesis
MRLLFFGDMASTGFGTVTMDLGRALLDRGVDVRFLSLNEVGLLPEPFASRTLSINQANGWIAMPRDAAEAEVMNARIVGLFGQPWPDGWAAEAAIVLGDVAAVRRLPAIQEVPVDFPILHYVPVEGVGMPPSWGRLWQRLTPIAMSEFGATEIERLTGSRPPVAYHGVDTDTFYPVSMGHPVTFHDAKQLHVLRSKAECKRALGLDPDRILLFRADRNMPRKRYFSMLRAIAPVMAKHPEVDFLYHCRTDDEGGNLADAISHFHPDIARRMIGTGWGDPPYGNLSREALAGLYNASDVYLSTGAEGFGLTIAEAMACGVPAVGIDYSAVPEVIGEGGIVVPISGLVDNPYDHFWAAADEPAFTAAVESLVVSKKKRQQLGFLAQLHVRRTFTWAKAAEVVEAAMPVREVVAA